MPRQHSILRLLSLLTICWGLIAGALPGAAAEIPPLQGRVNDHAGMLSGLSVQQLESMLANLEEEDSTQIAVLTINSLEGAILEEYALKVLEGWGLGQADLDNGALLLIVKNDRLLRIEVGYGLEGQLTDLTAGRIINQIITPHFRNGEFDQGVITGVTAMIAAVRGEFSAVETNAPPSSDQLNGLVIFLLFSLFNIGKILGRQPFWAGTVGAVITPLLGATALGPQWLILFALIPVGFVAGWLAAKLFSARPIAAGRGAGSPLRSSTGGFNGGFGGFGKSGGFGGFGGGGGGGGGGGASGRW